LRLRLTMLALAAVAAFPAAASAAAPSNDDRADARSIDLPANVPGSTKDATLEKSEPGSSCAGTLGPSVWFQASAASAGRVVVELQANGDLDVVVDVLRRVRSQTRAVDCDASDDKGQAATDFQATKGATYLIRVSQLPNSVAGTFTLRVSAPSAPARPPGAQLSQAGATRTLDRAANTDDAWAVSFKAGTSYRVHLSGRNGRCSTQATIYAPGASSFADATAVRSLGCNGYLLFTPEPGEGGRYSIRVQANRRVRGNQTYHLQVAPAGADDTALGIFVRNHARVHGSLGGGRIDVVDLYRFDVTRRSVTFLELSGGGDDFFLQLLDDRGHRLASGDGSIHRGTRPGRYFVAVRASGNGLGKYTLRRATRAITHTKTAITGGVGGLHVTAGTTPASSGTYEIVVQRFDPLAGWLFARRYRVHGSGSAGVTYVPPGVGRYRTRASFLGTRDAAASNSGYAYAAVGGPLRE